MRFLFLITVFAIAVAGASPAHATCDDAAINVRAPTMSGDDRKVFENQFRQQLKRVCRWWGATYEGPFDIDIDESRGPSMALVPAWRGNLGEMLFRAGTTRLGRSAITHEIIHVLAPNANRFLAEGLAVYAHNSLRDKPAYPNFGNDLTAEARKVLANADIAALERVATPTRLQLPDLDGRDSYVVAGSFVGFVIDKFGLDKFQELYALTPLVAGARNPGDPARWEQVLGVDLAALTEQWRQSLAE